MSIIDKVFASIGLGGIKIDAQLNEHIITAGGIIEGTVHIKGGVIGQSIDTIFLSIHTNLKEKDERPLTNSICLYRFQISKPLWIKAHSKKSIPFSFTLPLNLPLSYGGTKIWVSTDADIKMAINPRDKDFIRVYPEEKVATVINEIADIGFRLENTVSYRIENKSFQVLEFSPFEGSYLNQLEELEMIVHYETKDKVKTYLSFDRKKRSGSKILTNFNEMQEHFYELVNTPSALATVKDNIKLAIENHTRHL